MEIGVKSLPPERIKPKPRKSWKTIVKPSLKKKPEKRLVVYSEILWTADQKLFTTLFPGQLGSDLIGNRVRFFGLDYSSDLFTSEAVAAGVLLLKTYNENTRTLNSLKALRVFGENARDTGFKNPGVGKIFMWLLFRKNADAADKAFEDIWRGNYATHDITNFVYSDGTVYNRRTFADTVIDYDNIEQDLFDSNFKVLRLFFEQNINPEFWLSILRNYWRNDGTGRAAKIVYLAGGLLQEYENEIMINVEDRAELLAMWQANILIVLNQYHRDSPEFQAAYWNNPDVAVWRPLVVQAAAAESISVTVLEYLISVMDAENSLDDETKASLRASLEIAQMNRDLSNAEISERPTGFFFRRAI